MKIKSIEISKYDNNWYTSIKIFGSPVIDYKFDSFEAAIEALQNLDEVQQEISNE